MIDNCLLKNTKIDLENCVSELENIQGGELAHTEQMDIYRLYELCQSFIESFEGLKSEGIINI